MHLNLGKGLKRPYESKYSAFRRFLISNPTLSSSALKKISTSKIWDTINYKIPDKYNLKHINNYHIYGVNDVKTHCPICAQQSYHCDLFQLPWITKCPIHKVPLVDNCPSCKKPWPNVDEMIYRECLVCGKEIDYSNLIKSGKYNDESLYDAIDRLFDFVTFKYNEDVRLVCSFSNHSDRYMHLDPNNSIFPSYQKCRYPIINNELKELEVPISKINSKHFKIYEVEQLQDSYKTEHSVYSGLSWISDVRYKALLHIVRCIELAAPKHHQLEIFDFAELKQLELKSMMPLCPYCVAFSSWFHRITGIPHRYRVNMRNPLANLVERSMIYHPFNPVPMDYLYCDEKNYKTSLNFQKWLYHKDLLACFINIFNFYNRNLKPFLTGENQKIEDSNILKDLRDDIYTDNTVVCFPDLKNLKLHVKYRATEIRLPNIRGALTHCRKFKRIVKKEGLHELLKNGQIASPCSNGLNYAEHVVLEYGHQNYYKYPKKYTTHFLPETFRQ